MESLTLHTSPTAQWHTLIVQAQASTQRHLTEESESYLVFLLMRFTGQPEIASKRLAIDYLQGMNESGGVRNAQLREVGDVCLLYAGLFPRLALRRRVSAGYFVDLGRSAYARVAECSSAALALLYQHLARDFVPMMDVLQATRVLHGGASALTPLDAHALWQEHGAHHARQVLATCAPHALPVPWVPGDRVN